MKEEFKIENGILIEYLGNEDVVNIPVGVTEIGSLSFVSKSLSEVKIPNTTTIIGEKAFLRCNELKKVKCDSEHIIKIEEAAFAECQKLKELEIKIDNETEIGEGAFSECVSLADENGFVIIKNILYNYYGIGGDVVIPDGVTYIYNYCFKKCDPHQLGGVELKSVVFPDSLKKIGDCAFRNCKSLVEIIVPDEVSEIGKFAFEKCDNLEKIKLPQKLLRLDNYTFSQCHIEKIELPQSLTVIGEGALMNNKMEEISLPDNIEEIGKKAFAGQLYAYFKLRVKKGSVTEKIAKTYAKKNKNNIEIYE